LLNKIVVDTKKGLVYFGDNDIKIRYFISTEINKSGDIKIYPKQYYKDGYLAVIYEKNSGRFIVMDIQTFASNYVQMGLIGNYNKDLFDLVIKSKYGRIYKVKR